MVPGRNVDCWCSPNSWSGWQVKSLWISLTDPRPNKVKYIWRNLSVIWLDVPHFEERSKNLDLVRQTFPRIEGVVWARDCTSVECACVRKVTSLECNFINDLLHIRIVYEQIEFRVYEHNRSHIRRLFAFLARDFLHTFNALRIGTFDTLFSFIIYSWYYVTKWRTCTTFTQS